MKTFSFVTSHTNIFDGRFIKLKSAVLALVIICGQAAGMAMPFLPTQVAHAATPIACTDDVQGPNDETGQKDLTKMCSDTSTSASGYITINWNWDETSWSGNNSGDGCALFDTDNDGNANFSLCATVKGNPADIISTTVYSCSDAKTDRCTNPTLVNPITSSCLASVTATDPFPAGTNSPSDTTAVCTIQLSDVGGALLTKLTDVCSYPSQEPNSDPSDCIIATSQATVEVVKQLVPDTDLGKFDLYIKGTKYITNGGDNATTGPKVVDATKDVIVEEQAGSLSPTPLSSYTTSVSCVNQDNVTIASGNPTGVTSRPLTIDASDIAKGDSIVCTYTNTLQQAHLTLVKTVTNNNGGGALPTAWTLVASGPTPISGVTATPAVTNAAVNSGTYTLSEINGPNGYAGSTYSCVKNGGSAVVSNSITLAPTDNATCTINNDDNVAHLIVIKHVINDNNGNAVAGNFTTTITGVTTATPTAAGVESPGVNNTLTTVGSYSVDEVAHVGYAKTPSADCTGTIALGETKTCTITNDDIAPSLTVVKNVVNAHGGAILANGFTLKLNGSALTAPVMSNNNLTATYTASNVSANTPYTVTEDTTTGYTGSAVSCVDNTTHLTVSSPVTLDEGQSVTCTITNTDIAPGLTILKIVLNPYGTPLSEYSFPLFVDETQVTSGVNNTGFNAGTHYVSETQQTGYTLTSVSGCTPSLQDLTAPNLTISVLLSVGANSTCTLTNTAIQPKITLNKVIDGNQYGDTSTVNDFGLTIGGTPAISGTKYGKNDGSYAINEAGKSGYSFASITGHAKCPSVLGGTVNLSSGDDVTCTIHNTARQPKLTVIKVVTNNNGGTKVISDFPLFVNQTGVTSGVKNGFNVGNYTVHETTDIGYESSFSGDCSGSGLVTLNLGDDKTCTITNNDIAPSLKLVKTVTNNNGGTKVISDFPLAINGTTVVSGEPSTLAANVLYTATETNLSGYAPSVWGGDCASNGTITLAPGDHKTCTITNDDIQPKLTVTKIVTNDNGGTKVVADFPLFVNQAGVTSGVQNGFNAGVYTVSETGQTGYTGVVTGDCVANGTITLNVGDVKSCTITNNDIAPQLTLYKQVINDNSGKTTASDWTLIATPNIEGKVLSGNGDDGFVSEAALANVTYTLSESGQDGYRAGEWYCYSEGEGDFSYQNESTSEIRMREGADVTCVITNNDIPHPAIHVVKSGPKYAKAGEIVTYTFTVTNTGDIALNDISVLDSLTGAGTYVSGDSNSDNKLDITETWIYTGKYTIPANQKADVKNTVEVCGYDSASVNDNILELLTGNNNTERTAVCAQDKHSLSIPQVLAETVLVDTGGTTSILVAGFAALNIILVAGALGLTRRRKLGR